MPTPKPLQRWLIIALISCAVAYTAARQLGWLAFYTLPTTSMEPNYPEGKLIFTSNLFCADLNEVVSYRDTSIAFEGLRLAEENVFIGRIVARGGDQLELRNGRVYRNGQPTENDLLLKFLYHVNEEFVVANRPMVNKLKPDDRIPNRTENGMYLFLDDEVKTKFVGQEDFERYDPVLPVRGDFPAFVQEGWTLSNYGPLTIPPGHFFILGDSRHNSEDSRMRGFVPEDDVVGVVLN